jgi:DNA-binding CsgD family transcriptional regulator
VDGLVVGELASAVELLRQAPRPLLLARAEEELGRAALGRGDRSGVESLLRAQDDYAACGATADRTRVQRSLRSAGVRRRGKEQRSRPESGWESLTEMERRVAVLISDGHTNRSAAAELFVSPSTINTHLRAVFSKLGVHSRVQLAKLVLARSVDQDPDTPAARHQER